MTDIKYPPMTPAERAQKYGVALTQRNKLNLRDYVPNQFISLGEATAYGDSWFFPGNDICRLGHNAAKRQINPRICSDCDRLKAGEEPIYGKSKTQKYYDKPRRPAKDASAPVVIQAPPTQVEPTAKEQELLSAIAEHRDVDKGCAAVGWTRAKLDARVSVNEALAKALAGLTDRLGIATRAPDAETSKFTPELERQFAKAYVNCGLLEQARNDLGISASEFHARIATSKTFASLIEQAHPLAAATRRERAELAAAVGKIDLLRYLEAQAPKDDLSNLSPEQQNAELRRLIADLDAKGILSGNGPEIYEHRVTGQRICLRDYKVALDSDNFALEPAISNTDLVS